MTPPFADIAQALERQARELVNTAEELEHVGAAIGLSPALLDHIVADRRREAELIGAAFRLVRDLAPVENTIRQIVAAA